MKIAPVASKATWAVHEDGSVHMSTVVRQRPEQKLGDGIYRAVIADVEAGVTSRFNTKGDLVRVALDLVEEIDGQKPRLWLNASPNLQGRLQNLVEAAMNRKISVEEASGFDLEEIIGKEVNVVIAKAQTRAGFTYSQIITFLPVETK